ncbi:hypothetical protein BGW36DRAFT_425747 [Talaromyces proteolyticus]|uniref:Xylanolytic transcriptional activator regulatory domain-containing protein n=1 Tax=Talaromyces proteolyticus TaxID=1131652 RepID=A0AAD4KU62_9EURO|nr:uncharacterized protein BGW36DRAFT_425747 [Talaromyces proteolyticus]KAH8700948.1 hypothetical protein BGW36DRAFT_425747 [Talaromyces proteolyticus]
MASSSPVVLIFGAGSNIGSHVARAFAAKNYKVALVARKLKEAESTPDQLHIQGDLSDPSAVIDAFAKVKAAFGLPSVVVYNAAALTPNDSKSPLSLGLPDFVRDLNINTTSAFVAAQQAVNAFEMLSSSASRTFIYTGNLLNTAPIASLLDLGVGKSATAHIIHSASIAYKDRGFKFYYADERTANGGAAFAVDGEAHAKLFTQLAEDPAQGPWQEIERLQARVRELERQPQNSKHTTNHPSVSSTSALVSSSSPPLDIAGAVTKGEERRRLLEGIYTSTTQSNQSQWYGPSSSFFFIGRMSTYMSTVLNQPQLDRHMYPDTASKVSPSALASKQGSDNLENNSMSIDRASSDGYLTATQEDYFLDLFWQSYHCTVQIVDESEFRQHYRSLWSASSALREPCALVDIILALCIQCGIALMPRNNDGIESRLDTGGNDASIAGRLYYRRSQMLLSSDLESPTMMTLQCHIFSVIYLCNASFTNMAHTTLAIAVRTAHILGLHLEPPEAIPRPRRELRKRLWWALYVIESKICMKLGRPWCAQISEGTCQLPADDRELALVSGSNFGMYGNNVTWLTYSLFNAKLILAARAVYIGFSDKCADILAINDGKSLYTDFQSLETCAEFLAGKMEVLHNWAQSVPNALKNKRKREGSPLSIDGPALEVEMFAPTWLQRQRIVLELLYHNLSMNLYRPFIYFSSKTKEYSSLNIPYPMTEKAFQWAWNASLSLVGFLVAYPMSPLIQAVRDAINDAILIFEIFGNSFSVATSAAKVTHELVVKADLVIDQIFNQGASSNILLYDNLGLQPSYEGPKQTGMDQVGISFENVPADMFPITSSMDMALSVDSFYSFDPLYAGATNLAAEWVFGQSEV